MATRSAIVTGGGTGSVVSFLVSPDASYVNGVSLPVDGGALIFDPTATAFADPA